MILLMYTLLFIFFNFFCFFFSSYFCICISISSLSDCCFGVIDDCFYFFGCQ